MKYFLAVFIFSLLTACGGGGSDVEEQVGPPQMTIQPVNCAVVSCH